jgi:hypothetical protein
VIITPGKVRKDALEIMLGFSLIATEIIYFPSKKVAPKRFGEVIAPIVIKQKTPNVVKHDISSIMFSILSLCAGLIPVHMVKRKPEIQEAFDEENQAVTIKILI